MANLDWFEGGGLIGNDAGDRAKLMQPGDVVEVRPDQPLLPGGGIRTFGDFDDVESAFVGLFFENEATGTLHHGWVQLTLPSSGNGVITRFAYESDPETPILIPSPCPADIDRDGQVAFDDLLATLSSFGPCTACPEDLDGTGDVSFDDVLAVLAAWGPCPE